MKGDIIDFANIRGGTVEGQRSSFEQLVCHLAELDGSGGEFRRIEGSGGDGGVEALRILPTGRKIGYQAKYYPVASSDYVVETALDFESRLAHSASSLRSQHRYVKCELHFCTPDPSPL